jgi:toxin FitB
LLILDTNVLSELAKREPDKAVLAWANQQGTNTLWSTTITEAEILVGLELLPLGRRRDDLERAMAVVFSSLLSERVLSFDRAAAKVYTRLMSIRKSKGKSSSMADLQIAAIAVTHDAIVVTRNIDDLSDCAIELVNPWEYSAQIGRKTPPPPL